jgi:hypothetical protein
MRIAVRLAGLGGRLGRELAARLADEARRRSEERLREILKSRSEAEAPRREPSLER